MVGLVVSLWRLIGAGVEVGVYTVFAIALVVGDLVNVRQRSRQLALESEPILDLGSDANFQTPVEDDTDRSSPYNQTRRMIMSAYNCTGVNGAN